MFSLSNNDQEGSQWSATIICYVDKNNFLLSLDSSTPYNKIKAKQEQIANNFPQKGCSVKCYF